VLSERADERMGGVDGVPGCGRDGWRFGGRGEGEGVVLGLGMRWRRGGAFGGGRGFGGCSLVTGSLDEDFEKVLVPWIEQKVSGKVAEDVE
jgi:hypothetical protein